MCVLARTRQGPTWGAWGQAHKPRPTNPRRDHSTNPPTRATPRPCAVCNWNGYEQASFAEQVPLTQMSVTQAPGRTHMYYTGQPEFEFGDGLSYDAWEAQWHQHPGTTQPGGQGEEQEGPAAVALTTEDGSSATFKVKVGNKGTFGGACTLLAFWRPLGAAADRHIAGTVPLKQKLFGFGGVRVSAGGSGVVELTLKSEHLVGERAPAPLHVPYGKRGHAT